MNKWKMESQTEYTLDLVDPEGWYRVSIKWDGCIDLTRLFNRPLPITGDHPQLVETLHICDIEDFIERLEEIIHAAKIHFSLTGKDYEYWETIVKVGLPPSPKP